MSDNIHINEDGIASAAFATDKNGLPWHKLGQMIDHAMKWNEAYIQARLCWTVEKRSLFFKNPLWKPGDPITEKGFEYPGQFGIFRTDLIGPKSALGIVGNTYVPTQNSEIGLWIDNILEQIDGAHYEAAGVLGRGERVWALARVPFNASIGNDIHQTFLLFMSAHDGTMSNTIMMTDVRVVCQNTLNMALSHNTQNAIKVRHTASAKEKLNKITSNIQTGLKQDVESLKLKFEKLITRKVTKDSFVQTMTKIFGEKWEQSDNKSAKALEIAQLFHSNDNNAIPEQAGTGMALLNAVTNYVDHNRPSRVTANSGYSTMEQARAHSAMAGAGSQLKTATLEYVLEAVEMEPVTHNPNPTVQVEKNQALDNILGMIE